MRLDAVCRWRWLLAASWCLACYRQRPAGFGALPPALKRAPKALDLMGEHIVPDPDVSHPELLRNPMGLPEVDFTNHVASGMA